MEDYIEKQNAQDVLTEMDIKDHAEEQKAQEEMDRLLMEDYIEKQNAQDVLELTDEEIEWYTQLLQKNLHRNKNNSTENKNGKN